MSQITDNYESLPNNTSATTSNTNATAVYIGAGNTLQGDTSMSAHGTTSIKSISNANPDSNYVEYALGSAASTIWFRCYWYYSATPAPADIWFAELRNGASTRCGGLSVSNGNKLILKDTGSNLLVTTTSLSTGAWYRIEAKYVMSTSVGVGELKLFSSIDSSTATETLTSSAAQNFGASVADRIRFGNPIGFTFIPQWNFDDVGISDTAYLGPAVAAVNPHRLFVSQAALIRANHW